MAEERLSELALECMRELMELYGETAFEAAALTAYRVADGVPWRARCRHAWWLLRPRWWRRIIHRYSLDDPLHWLLTLRCGLLGHRWGETRMNGEHGVHSCRWYPLHREWVCWCHRTDRGWWWWLKLCCRLRGPKLPVDPADRCCRRCGRPWCLRRRVPTERSLLLNGRAA